MMTQIELNCYFHFQKLTEELSIHRILNVKNDHYKVQYRNADGQNVLTIGKKEFAHAEHQIKFKESWVSVRRLIANRRIFHYFRLGSCNNSTVN